jgi:hypothetical protein
MSAPQFERKIFDIRTVAYAWERVKRIEMRGCGEVLYGGERVADSNDQISAIRKRLVG